MLKTVFCAGFTAVILGLGLLCTTDASWSEETSGRAVLFPQPSPKKGFDWLTEIERQVPKLTHDRGSRWPLVLWRIVPSEKITPEVSRMLMERGLAPSLPLFDADLVTAARTLERANLPVIVTSGIGVGNPWPYSLAGDKGSWSYRFKYESDRKRYEREPIPTLIAGWAKASAQIRQRLLELRIQGVTVDAAWLDYEGRPVLADYRAAISSDNGRHWIPDKALISEERFAEYTRRLWIALISSYIAAPFREIFPKISVTNWVAVLSLPDFPVLSWQNQPLPMVGPTLFTATNPVAYGIDVAFNHLTNTHAMTYQREVDAVYTEILLRQASADGYARDRVAPEINAIVWIARWVRDDTARATPMMSRPAYREALRHLWLRGVDAMEIFSPVRKGFEELAIQEIIDASVVYNEMLAYAATLTHGRVLNHSYAISTPTQVLWSGMCFDKRAVIRATSFSGKPEKLTIDLGLDTKSSVDAIPGGATTYIDLPPGFECKKPTAFDHTYGVPAQ